jgi:hypothetical protein
MQTIRTLCCSCVSTANNGIHQPLQFAVELSAQLCRYSRSVFPWKWLLPAGAAAGQAAMLVALGTIVVLKPQQVQQMAAAFASLPHVRFVWSLKEVRHAVCCSCMCDQATEWRDGLRLRHFKLCHTSCVTQVAACLFLWEPLGGEARSVLFFERFQR